MTPGDCRSFGDPYFVLFCPKAATVVSTNLRDIKPMADAIGVRVTSLDEALMEPGRTRMTAFAAFSYNMARRNLRASRFALSKSLMSPTLFGR